MTGRDLIYWDTCAFLAFFKEEHGHGFNELKALQQQAYDFDNGLILIATSTIAILEVLSSDISDHDILRFEQMRDRSNFVLVEANEQIMRRAAEVRRYYHGMIQDGDGKALWIGSPDAIHVASAIEVGARALMTLDKNNKNHKREAGLLKISDHGKVLGTSSLLIQLPSFGFNVTII